MDVSSWPGLEDPGDYRLLVGSGAGLRPDVGQRAHRIRRSAADGHDQSVDLIVITQPGIGLAGQVVFAEGPPERPPEMRIAFRRPESSGARANEMVATKDDELRFYGSDVFGPRLVGVHRVDERMGGQGCAVRGEDITDVPTTFRPEDDDQLQVVVSSRASTLEGAIRGEGTPPGEATVYVFGEDRGAWRMSSPRTHKSDVGEDGRFSVGGLAAGRYYADRGGSGRISSAREPGRSVLRTAEQGGDAVRHRRRRTANTSSALALAGIRAWPGRRLAAPLKRLS